MKFALLKGAFFEEFLPHEVVTDGFLSGALLRSAGESEPNIKTL